jgi:CubicO group peptidase (beta-lactamase class C family)
MSIRSSITVRVLGITLLVLASTASALADAVDDFVRAQMKAAHIPGVAIAVIKDGKPVKVRGYGFGNIELETPVTPGSVFFIGSLSKQIIAVATLKLIADGRLSLDDRAVTFLEGAPAGWNGITVRHLLTHTSGLVNEGPGFNRLRPQSDADVIKSAYDVPLVFPPGEKYQYSNLGYFVLAEIVAKESGQSWPVFVQERIFSPLGMNASGVVDTALVVPHRVNGYVYRNGKYQNAPTLLALRPSGAFRSSLNDMVKWDAALTNATILPQQMLYAMWTPVVLRDGSRYPYGFGFQIESYGSHRAISHGGSLNGFRNAYLRLPDDKLSVLVLTNSDNASPNTIATHIAAEYVKDLFPRRKFAPLSAKELDQLAGSYRLETGRVVVTRSGQGLVLNAGIDVFLLPSSPRVFFSPDDPRVQFEFDREGETVRMTRYSNDEKTYVAIKE